MRIAMFGGSFNPIHLGHIEIATAVRKKYGIDKVLFTVANDPPHKEITEGVPAYRRFAMVQLGLEGIVGAGACDLELRRPGKSYTVETLKELHTLYPENCIYCIIGADMLLTIDTWHRAPELLRLAKFIAVGRPHAGSMEPKAERLHREYGADITISGIMGPDISSTMVREAVGRGEDISNLLPRNVEDYIYQNGLYLPDGINRIRARLQHEMSPKRYAHTMRVVQAALRLASMHGTDKNKARLGALLHDCAKLNSDDQLKLAEKYGLDIRGMALPIIHGPIGAVRAQKDFSVTDREILQAISRHTVCGPNMTDLDKIVYLADKIEHGRTYDGVERIRKAACRSLNEGMIASIEHSLSYLSQRGAEVHPDTLKALDELKNERTN